MRKVLVFGTFDGLHPGHYAFLTEAKSLGDHLTVSVAQDAIVMELKNHEPIFTLVDRMQALRELPMVDELIAGDRELGHYRGLQAVKPDLVAFGYDQLALASDFARFQQATGDETPTVVLKPYQADKYKSSLLRST